MHKGIHQEGTALAHAPTQPQNKKQKWLQLVGALIVAGLLFSSGWAFGRGDISLKTIKKGEVSSTPRALNYSSVDEVYDALKDNYDGSLTNEALLDGLKSGLASASQDPYTEYFNEKDSKDFQDQLNGSFEGIGAELGKDGSNIVIIAPIKGAPAEAAGLKPKDIILKVDNTTTENMSVDQAVKRIRGKAGTKVTLQVARSGALVEIEITRGKITMPSVTWKVDGTIGILTVSRFAEDTSRLVHQAADEFADKQVNGIVLDLRSDPGGLLDQAVKLSSEWLANNTVILREKRGGKVTQTFRASSEPNFKDVKTVVLINEGSASASEITAGALHDNKVATLMGVKSYGKGSVQQIVPLPSGGTLKVTVARWFTPNDKNIDKEGITPDTEVKQNEDDLKNGVDTQLQAALAALRK